jgi:hypothetical protein
VSPVSDPNSGRPRVKPLGESPGGWLAPGDIEVAVLAAIAGGGGGADWGSRGVPQPSSGGR